MASEYVKLHIMKHALQHYINRDGASEKDIRQEKRVLSEVTEKLEQVKERINSGLAYKAAREVLKSGKCQ